MIFLKSIIEVSCISLHELVCLNCMKSCVLICTLLFVLMFIAWGGSSSGTAYSPSTSTCPTYSTRSTCATCATNCPNTHSNPPRLSQLNTNSKKPNQSQTPNSRDLTFITFRTNNLISART